MTEGQYSELEKLDMIRKRMKVGYSEAKKALDENSGEIVPALTALEAQGRAPKNAAILDKVLELVQKGNDSKVLVSRRGKEMAKVPLNAAILGSAAGIAIYPVLAAALIGAAWYTDWSLKFDKAD